VERHGFPWTVVSMSQHYENPTYKGVLLLQRGRHHQFIEKHDLVEKLLIWR
jgi:hypothetical protein